MIPSHIRRGNDAIKLHQFGKLLRRALKGECDSMTRFKAHHRKHLFSDTKQQVIPPLNLFIYVGKRETVTAN
jgi:hypothetical protein